VIGETIKILLTRDHVFSTSAFLVLRCAVSFILPLCMLQDVFELEIFSLVTGCFSVLAVIILAIVVKQLSVNINR